MALAAPRSVLLPAILLVLHCGTNDADIPGTTPPDVATDAAVPSDATSPPDAAEIDVPRSVERGLYVTVKVASLTRPFDADGNELARFLAKPWVHGVSLQIGWADLEPTPGAYENIVVEAVTAAKKLIAQRAQPTTLKIHLRNGLVPDWLVPAGTGSDAGDAPFVFTTTLGFRALGEVTKTNGGATKVDVTLVPTESGYVTHVNANIAELARQLDLVDPDGDAVRIVEVAGPSSESGGTMRLTPSASFPRDGSPDTFGLGWTFPAHLAAWKAIGPLMATFPAYRRRQWTFDLTHEAPTSPKQFGLSTADQVSVVDALAAAHPWGKSGIRLMNEGAAAQDNKPAYTPDAGAPNKCEWAGEHFADPTNMPETTIAAWPDHEWQVQGSSDDANNFPRFELARNLLFGDPTTASPALLQHSSFVEVHDDQVLDKDDVLLDGTNASAWFSCLDGMVRKYASASALSSADQTFWSGLPSLVGTCAAYPAPPPSTTCAPP